MLNIEPQIENIVLHLYKTMQQMKWSKLILIDLTLMLNVCCLSASVVIIIITRLIATTKSSHNISIIYC